MEGNEIGKCRVFLALPVTPFTGILSAKIEQLRPFFPHARWTELKDLHITLHFFGSLERSKLKILKSAARASVSTQSSFPVSLGDFGFFPTEKSATVVWAGVGEGRDPVSRIHAVMKEILEKSGFETDARPFHPHVTLGRLSRESNRVPPDLPSFPATPLEMIREVALYESHLSPGGSTYRVLETFPFS